MVVSYIRLLPTCLLTLAIVGCQVPLQDGAADTLSWEALQARLHALPAWQLRARLQAQAPGGRQTAWVLWRQEGEQYSVRLSDLLGRTALLLEVRDGQAALKRPGQEPVRAAAAEQALQHALGWAVPASQLRYWLLGLPAPDLPATAQRVESGVLVELQQLGWHLQLGEHREVEGLRLPILLQAERDDLRISLSISHWYFPNS